MKTTEKQNQQTKNKFSIGIYSRCHVSFFGNVATHSLIIRLRIISIWSEFLLRSLV